MQSQKNNNWWFEVRSLWQDTESQLVFDLEGKFDFETADNIKTLTPLDGRVFFSRVDEENVLVRIKDLKIKVELECQKCLEKFVQEVYFEELSEVFYAWSENSDDWSWDWESGGVDLAEFLREKILLSLPAIPVCRRDCKGICAQCGANLNKQKCKCVSQKKSHQPSPFDGLEKLFTREK